MRSGPTGSDATVPAREPGRNAQPPAPGMGPGRAVVAGLGLATLIRCHGLYVAATLRVKHPRRHDASHSPSMYRPFGNGFSA